MKYLDIVARQEEMQETGMAMQKESQELQDMKIEFAQSHTSFDTEHKVTDNLDVYLMLNYADSDDKVLSISTDTDTLHLTIEEFNQIGGFLQKHNDVIFSYMSEITKVEEDVD